MQFATGGLWRWGEGTALRWPARTVCDLFTSHFSAQNVSRTETRDCSRTGTNFALEKWLNEKRYSKHYFCSNTYMDVSWEELLKTMSWNDAKLMWEQNHTVCVMHFGSLNSVSLLILSQLFKICAVPLTSLEFMRVHVRFTDSACCGF